MAWKSIRTLSTGKDFTQTQLQFKRVRLSVDLIDVNTNDLKAPNSIGQSGPVKANTEGFIGYVQPTADIFPVAVMKSGSLPESFELLKNKKSDEFMVLRINWATLVGSFLVDVPDAPVGKK